jgi:hypothetical protein
MLRRLADLDRRWIFLVVALAVVAPLVWPLRLPIEPSAPTRGVYAAVEALPPGALVCMSFDYGPGTKVECHPMALAALRHAFRKEAKVVAIALWPEGALFAREALRQVGAEMDRAEGLDYVNLGYKSGGEVVLRGIADDFRNIYSTDLAGRRVDELPLMSRVRGWKSFDLVCDWSMGNPGLLQHVRVVATQYGRPLVAGVTAVTAPEAYPFLNSGQVQGLLSGLRGAAEYEVMVGHPGTATRGMDAQSVVHFVIAGFIVVANLLYFADRRERRRRQERNR